MLRGEKKPQPNSTNCAVGNAFILRILCGSEVTARLHFSRYHWNNVRALQGGQRDFSPGKKGQLSGPEGTLDLNTIRNKPKQLINHQIKSWQYS